MEVFNIVKRHTVAVLGCFLSDQGEDERVVRRNAFELVQVVRLKVMHAGIGGIFDENHVGIRPVLAIEFKSEDAARSLQVTNAHIVVLDIVLAVFKKLE